MQPRAVVLAGASTQAKLKNELPEKKAESVSASRLAAGMMKAFRPRRRVLVVSPPGSHSLGSSVAVGLEVSSHPKSATTLITSSRPRKWLPLWTMVGVTQKGFLR